MKNRMIILFQLLPVIFSMLILAAHFSRAGNSVLMIISFILPFILFIRHSIIVRIMQAALLLGTIEWIRTVYVFSYERADAGQPWLRLVIILGVVALFTFASAFVFSLNKIKERYGLNK